MPLKESKTQSSNDHHVWIISTNEALDRAKTDVFIEILSKSEHDRYVRFRFDRDRQIFLIAHALLRCALSAQYGGAPHSWVFQENDYGRPELGGAMEDSGPRFNLSHTQGLAACVVTRDVDCGVDVEFLQRTNNLLQIARKMFSENEVNNLQSLSLDKQRKVFLTYWTLKEAYVKARGIGLSLPTKEIEFEIDDLNNINVMLGHQLEDVAEDWNFTAIQPTPEHLLALAIKASNRNKPEIIYHEVGPEELIKHL